MNETFGRDRLKPFLLDRLKDDWATRPWARRRDDDGGAAAGALDPDAYRATVVRDLHWLLNTQAPPPGCGIGEFPEVASSVLNYGLPQLSTLTREQVRDGELERLVAGAIERFEPRILPRTLTVELISPEDAAGHVELLIEGMLWAVPAAETLRLRTEYDPSAGRWSLKEP